MVKRWGRERLSAPLPDWFRRSSGFNEHNTDVQSKIKEDLQSRSLQYRAIKPGELAYGFIFYPGEAKTAKVLRLQLRAKDTGEISTFNMKLKSENNIRTYFP